MSIAYTPGTRIDHYEIIRMLGRGGMNRVYLAKDLNNQQKVVLKFPNDDLIGNIAVFERYKREAEIGNRLNHSHIQHLLNMGEERREHYLVMEYINGRTLGAMMYEMLCGHPPFEGENVFAVMNLHVSQDPPPILDCNPNLSPVLATVVIHAIRRDPEKRYKSIKDMLHDLSNLEEVKPIPYHPDTPTMNRSGRAAITATLIIIAICLVIIAIGFLAQFAHHVTR